MCFKKYIPVRKDKGIVEVVVNGDGSLRRVKKGRKISSLDSRNRQLWQAGIWFMARVLVVLRIWIVFYFRIKELVALHRLSLIMIPSSSPALRLLFLVKNCFRFSLSVGVDFLLIVGSFVMLGGYLLLLLFSGIGYVGILILLSSSSCFDNQWLNIAVSDHSTSYYLLD